jgi:hypothetical protein
MDEEVDHGGGDGVVTEDPVHRSKALLELTVTLARNATTPAGGRDYGFVPASKVGADLLSTSSRRPMNARALL